jgi:4-hydroxythreonine-4-phosphate dehydrogenase
VTTPRVGISLGDPGGIGPEITARALADGALLNQFVPIVFGGLDVWKRACRIAGVPDRLKIAARPGEAHGPTLIECDHAAPGEVPFGQATPRAGRSQKTYLERAVDALTAGEIDGLCTAPVNKAAVDAAGLPFTGHTDYLRERFDVPRVVMLMAGERLRVALATMHVAVKAVPASLRTDELFEIGRLVARELAGRFGIAAPRIAVCGLNPHAGEEGHFGDEETRIIVPAIARLQEAGVQAEGPFPADGLFPRAASLPYDAILAMYHDQGLIPFKMREFHTGVNVTLGLPRPRTSPDHGVAYDIAGRGTADPRSMMAALRLCIRLVQGQANPPA